MRSLTVLLALLLVTLNLQSAAAQQEKARDFSLETEPVAYLLGGAGLTASYQYGMWSYSVEAFGELTIPESLHGNTGFGTSLRGIELQVERFINGPDGFFAGPEIGISRLQVTRKETGNSVTRTNYSIGLRGGYHWNTGLGNLYLAPVAGVSYALNSGDIQIGDAVFQSSAVTPFATVGIGWSL